MRLPIIATLTACAVLSLAGPVRAQPPFFAPPGAVAGPGPMPWGMGEPYGMGMPPGGDPVHPGPRRSIEERGWDFSQDPVNDHIWSVGVEAVLLKRSTPRDQVLVRAGAFDPSGTSLLTTDDLKFDAEFMPRVNAVLHRASGFDLAFSWFEADHWQASRFVAVEEDISYAAPNVLLNTVNAVRFTSSSELASAELGVQWRVAPRLRVLAGLRWMELTDSLLAEDNFPNLDIFIPSYTIDVDNRLTGAQVGVAGTLRYFGDHLSIDGLLKVGYYENRVRHQIEELAGQSLIGGLISDAESDTATVTELRITATVRFNEHVKAWMGYDLMWMIGMATAPSQISGNDVFGAGPVERLGPEGALGVDSADNLFFYGFNVGLELSY